MHRYFFHKAESGLARTSLVMMTGDEHSSNVMFECKNCIYDYGPAYQGNVSLVRMFSKKRNENFTLKL